METDHNSTIPKTPLRFLVFMFWPWRYTVLGILLVVVIGEVGDAIPPFILKMITDSALAGDSDSLVFWVIAFPVLAAIQALIWRSTGFLGMRVITKADRRGHRKLFEYLSLHSDNYFSDRFAGSLSNKLTRAVSRTIDIIEGIFWNYVPFIVQLIVTLAVISYTDWRAGLFFFVIILTIVVIDMYLVRIRRPMVVAYAESDTAVTGKTVDAITNIRAIHQFARRKFEIERIDDQLKDRRAKDLKQWQFSEWILVVNDVLVVALIAGVLSFVYLSWQAGAITAGDLVLIITLLAQMVLSLVFFGSTINGFLRNYAEVQEGLEVITVPHEMVDDPHASQLVVNDGHIHFDKVDFWYPQASDAKVFDRFDLTIPAHQKVGLVGASGAGKTTFVALLLRQHDVSAGAIKIDGQPIGEMTQESLRQAISVVPQEPMLFHRSLMENVRYGNIDATDEEVIRAAKMAQAHDFIQDTPQKYDTLVGERGVKLSGGQRQRIAIARAILKNSPILILDEATSALDSESEVLIQEALHTLMEGKTVIAIAHRLSTLREMDRIIVMEAGQIVQDGTHEVLTKEAGTFKKLWEHQAGGFLTD